MIISLNHIAFWIVFTTTIIAIVNNPYHIGKWFYEFDKGVQGVGQFNQGE